MGCIFLKVLLLSLDSSARGNTSLESAVSLTKALRWEIQSLALRLATAANAEEESRRSRTRVKTRLHHEAELRFIVEDIKRLLVRIEDAVPLINLAITTSGASLSTSLPATVSPSRLLQASTFLTAGDTRFSIEPSRPVQVGPAFILSLYMLFAGHAHRAHVEEGGIRDTTWKEVIHKGRLKLFRVPLAATTDQLAGSGAQHGTSSNDIRQAETDKAEDRLLLEESKANEFAYRLEIIEDLEDERVHSFEDDESQPGPYKDVQLAGIRELIPIHEISKIFYADTGKILNIGNDGESNSPVLLLKRDVNALPPRRMMERSEQDPIWHEEPEEVAGEVVDVTDKTSEADNTQSVIDHQLRRESLFQASGNDHRDTHQKEASLWRFPPNLDPEWLAFEVYTEAEDGSSGDEQDANDDPAYISGRPSSSARRQSTDSSFAAGLANLHLASPSPSSISKTEHEIHQPSPKPPASPFGPIRSSLSLLEMLIRLTALQQFQQASHLSIPDELLTFFLEESSTTGAGPDGEERRRKRHEARQKVGFDPYDESPVKRRGEDYQYQSQYQDRNAYRGNPRAGTPHDEFDPTGEWYPEPSRHRSRDHTSTPQVSPSEPWLLRSREHSSSVSGPRSRQNMPSSDPAFPSSPQSPYVPPPRRTNKPLDRVQQARGNFIGKGNLGVGNPLGRGMSADTDSSLGTSPGMLGE